MTRKPNDVLDGRYLLRDLIGQGGFGDVWRAVELLPDGAPLRDVALKLMAPDLAGDSWAEEARLLASFSHESLVTIFAAGILQDGGVPFVAMELLTGETLGDALRRRGKLTWRAALGYTRDVAGALDVIHARGIVHLDLKPANLFLTQSGRIKVLDFGISRKAGARPRTLASKRMVDDASLSTAVLYGESDPFGDTHAVPSTEKDPEGGRRGVAGTPGFVAPEVLELSEPTSAADAYALAATLVQLATGHLPHVAAPRPDDDHATAEQVHAWWLDVRESTLRGTYRDLEADGIPSGVAALVRRLLAVDPELRGAPPGSLRAQLDEVHRRPHGVKPIPYPGLLPYEDEREGTLFGRAADIQRMVQSLMLDTALVIHGPRGSGKTSLIEAGVIPELAKSRLDGKEDWRSIVVDPRATTRVSDILRSIAREKPLDRRRLILATSTLRSKPDAAEETPKEDAAPTVSVEGPRSAEGEGEGEAPVISVQSPISIDDPDALPATLPAEGLEAALSTVADGMVGAVIVVDPIEALLDLDEGERRSLVDLIRVLMRTPVGHGIRVVAALDDQFADQLIEVGGFDESLRGSFLYLGEPKASEAREIVAGPASLLQRKIEGEEKVVSLVNAALKRNGLLPFVSASLARFWEDAASKKTELRGARYAELGGATGAMLEEADVTLRSFDTRGREVMTEVLLLLSSTEGQLIERSSEELNAQGADPETVDRVVSKLVERHLLVRFSRTGNQKGANYRIADASLLSWPHLTSARLGAMDRLGFRERLYDAAVAWERSGQREEYLVFGKLFQDLRTYASGLRGLSQVEKDFVRQCRRARTRRTLTAVLLGVFVLLVATGLWFGKRALEERRAEAEEAEKNAQKNAYLAEIIGRARRARDPYEKIAFVVEAIHRGSADPSLSVELFDALDRLAPASFLTLERIKDLEFYWDERWAIGKGPAGSMVAIDLRPTKGETEIIEQGSREFGSAQPLARRPRVLEVMPTADPVVEIVPFSFATGVVTRSATGDVRVVFLHDDAEIVLAGAPAMKCVGKLVVSERGASVGCTTDSGFSIWDMKSDSVFTDPTPAVGGALSANGEWAITWTDKEARILHPSDGAVRSIHLGERPLLASFSSKEPVVALVGSKQFEIVDARLGTVLFDHSTFAAPTSVTWDASGVDLTVCSMFGEISSTYLRKGYRAKNDPKPSPKCEMRSAKAPPSIANHEGMGPLRSASAGSHLTSGGFKLSDGRYLTRSLVMLSPDDSLERLWRFEERSSDGKRVKAKPSDTFLNVVRNGDVVFVEGETGIAALSAIDSTRLLTAEGHLLGVCQDGRVAAWKAEGNHYKVFDVRLANSLGTAARKPGIVVGISPTCDRLYTEDLDGTLVSHKLGADESETSLGSLDGFVYDAKAAVFGADEPGKHAGLILALSSGKVLRIDSTSDTLRTLGIATPFATAIADGPGPLEAIFADATGVRIARANGDVDRVLGDTGSVSAQVCHSACFWEDIAVSADKRSLLLASAAELSVLDLGLKDLVFASPHIAGFTRFARWDDAGSVLAYSPSLEGRMRGSVLPAGDSLATRIGVLTSNLRVSDGRLVLAK